jgi:uncharacterized membrane protein
MSKPAKKRRFNPLAWLSASFATGLAVVLPFAITIAIILAVVSFVDRTVVPLAAPLLPPDMAALARALPGAGALIAVLALVLIGALAANAIGRFVVRQTERVFNTAPLVKGVYGSAKQIVETMSNPGGQSFKAAVLIEFPTPGQWSIAFITNENAVQIQSALDDDQLIAVYVPSCPIPTAGFLVYVRRSAIRPLGQGPEEALKLVMSAGIIKAAPTPPAKAA